MFKLVNLILTLIISLYIGVLVAEDVSVTINAKKCIHVVDKRFVSVVIDPHVLFDNLKISSQTLYLARHLSPALLRIHGPSTTKIIFQNPDDIEQDDVLNSDSELIVTPSMWKSLNEWLINANLTPVFSLSDRDRINGAWNPKATALPFMEITDKMNITCYWEIANELPNKSLRQYVEDVTLLRDILDAFPANRNRWSVVGGDFSYYTSPENIEVAQKLLKDSDASVEAFNLTPKSTPDAYNPKKITKSFSSGRSKKPSLWTTALRSPNPTSFKDGLQWANQLGQVAKLGYDVVFRQPSVEELSELTPAYWVSMFHKNLMGRNVLEARTSVPTKSKCFVYAHCTRRPNRFAQRGAATLLAVNFENEDRNVSVRFLGAIVRDVEIQTYFLTTMDENSSEIYLNGKLLTISDFSSGRLDFMPKIHHAQATKSLILNLPSKSIGFLVIPGARLPACLHEENQIDLELNRNDLNQQWNILTSGEHKPGRNVRRNVEMPPFEGFRKNNKRKKFLGGQANKSVELLEMDNETLSNEIKMLEQRKALLKQLLQQNTKKQVILTLSNNDLKNLIANQTQEADSVKVQITVTEASSSRAKRGLLVSTEKISGLEEDKERKRLRTARKVRNEDEDSGINMEIINNIDEPRDSSKCPCQQKKGQCLCGLGLHFRTTLNQQKTLQQVNGNLKDGRNYLDETENESDENASSVTGENKDLKELKSMLEQYHFEMQNAITTTKKNKTAESIKNNGSRKTKNSGEISKSRQKRTVSKEPTKLQKEIDNIRLRIKARREMLRNSIRERLHRKRTKRNIIQKIVQNKVDEDEPKVNAVIKSNQEESVLKDKSKTDLTPTTNNKLKVLNRKLVQQKKLEDKLSTYLLKVKESNAQLSQKIQRNERSVSNDNSRNEIRIDHADMPKLKRQYGVHNLKIVKREIIQIPDLEQTRKFETFMHEISEPEIQHKKSPKSVIKPNRDILTNEIPKDILADTKETSNEISKIVLLNSKEANNDIPKVVHPNSKEALDYKYRSISASPTTSCSYIPPATTLKQLNDKFSASTRTETVTERGIEIRHDGLVDNVFQTVFNFLNNFRLQVLQYLNYLSQ